MERFDVTEHGSLEEKRLYLPLTIKCKCPKCGTINEHDFRDNYLSYPIINKVETIGVYCNECETYFDQKMVLKIAVEIHPNEVTWDGDKKPLTEM